MDCKRIFRPTSLYVYVALHDKGMLLYKARCEGFEGAPFNVVVALERLWKTSTKITRNTTKIRTITSL